MKSERGITLTSLIVYVIAMVIVVGIVSTLTGYFYGNLDALTNRTESSKGYTTFNSYFTNEINTKENEILQEVSNKERVVFSNGNQYKFQGEAIYMNKIQICKNVTKCEFAYNGSKTITVSMTIAGKSYNNTYTLNDEN